MSHISRLGGLDAALQGAAVRKPAVFQTVPAEPWVVAFLWDLKACGSNNNPMAVHGPFSLSNEAVRIRILALKIINAGALPPK